MRIWAVPRGIDTDLLVQVGVRERQLNGLPDLLLLNIKTTDVGVRLLRLLVRSEERNGAVRLRRQHVDQRVGVLVKRDRRRRLEQLAIKRRCVRK